MSSGSRLSDGRISPYDSLFLKAFNSVKRTAISGSVALMELVCSLDLARMRLFPSDSKMISGHHDQILQGVESVDR